MCSSPEPGGGGEAEAEAEGEAEGAPSCARPAPELAACYGGAAFSDCGGADSPVIGCDATDCRWFTGGCVARGYATGTCPPTADCMRSGEGDPCYWLRFAYGHAPWDRTRATALDVAVDASVAVTATAVTCDGCRECAGDVCSNTDGDRATASLPGTLIVDLDPEGGYLGGRRAELEVDLAASRARLCWVRMTDVVPVCADPPDVPVSCAVAGRVAITRAPARPSDLDALAGTIDASFEDGLVMHARFVTLR